MRASRIAFYIEEFQGPGLGMERNMDGDECCDDDDDHLLIMVMAHG